MERSVHFILKTYFQESNQRRDVNLDIIKLQLKSLIGQCKHRTNETVWWARHSYHSVTYH